MNYPDPFYWPPLSASDCILDYVDDTRKTWSYLELEDDETKKLEETMRDHLSHNQIRSAERTPAYVEFLDGLDPEQNSQLVLNTLLHDSSWIIRSGAARLLAKVKKAIPLDQVLVALNREGDPNVKASILRTLGRWKLRKVVSLVSVFLLNDDEWMAREAAAWALGELKGSLAKHILIQAFQKEPLAIVRIAILRALVKTKSSDSKEAIKQAIFDRDKDVREEAELILTFFSDEEEV